jgi:uncharacterized protein YqeY
MTIQQQIKIDLMGAMKAKDEDKKSTLRVIMGEFARAAAKELSDDEVIKVLKKLIKSEKETLAQKGSDKDTVFIQIIETYLPQMTAEDEIVAWVNDNIDFSQFKSRMQAMGPIMKHFGARADGNVVKGILQGLKP